jgi:hypothetical protein
MKDMKYILSFALLFFLSPVCFADSLYVAYRWVKPGNASYTDSWCILNTTFNTNTQAGMEALSEQLAKMRGTETVVITYVRVLQGDTPVKERGKDLFDEYSTGFSRWSIHIHYR